MWHRFMDAGEGTPHLFRQHPMRGKGERRCDKAPVENVRVIRTRSRRQQQQILGHKPRRRFKRMQVRIGCRQRRAVMRLQIRRDHRQDFPACAQPLGRGGEHLAMAPVEQPCLLGKLACSPRRIPERVPGRQPFGFATGPQSKGEPVAKPLPGGLFTGAVHFHPFIPSCAGMSCAGIVLAREFHPGQQSGR